jgi:dolichol-phosphate mannosyltransferase
MSGDNNRDPVAHDATLAPLAQRLARPARFLTVGLAGLLVNSLLLWLLVETAHLHPLVASIIASEAAIVHNFLLNDRWTFRAQSRQHSPLKRLARFNGVALGGMLVTVALLTVLVTSLRLDLLAANVVAVGAATLWNYVVNSRWTWRADAAR